MSGCGDGFNVGGQVIKTEGCGNNLSNNCSNQKIISNNQLVLNKQLNDLSNKIDKETPDQCLYKDEESCNNHDCSWCISGAIEPACNTLISAVKLPSAVFTCSKVSGPSN